MNTNTQGNWTWTNANSDDYIDIDCDGNRIASIFINPEFPEQKHEHKANAELIVKAVNFYTKMPRLFPNGEVPIPSDEYILKCVNERKALLDSHRELLELVKWVSRVTNNPEIGIKCDKAINNANKHLTK